MPKYTKTRKNAPEGVDYISTVRIGEVDVVINLGKAGTYKIATPQIDGATVKGTGKTFDDAIDDLIKVMDAQEGTPLEPVTVEVKALTQEDVAPVKATSKAAKTTTETPVKVKATSEAAPEATAPVMNAGKVAALVMSAYRRSAAAVTDMIQGKITGPEAQKIVNGALIQISEDCAAARKSGVDADKVGRLQDYGVKIVGHHNCLAGGEIGNRLTSAQSKRARQKLSTVAASLVL